MEVLNDTLLTLWDYPLSVLELIAVLTGFAAVLLASKAWSVNFLFGIVNSVAYFLLYFQYRLYSVMLLQIVYFSFSIYGYYHWRHPKSGETDQNKEQKITKLTFREQILYLIVIVVSGLIWGWCVIHFQARFPQYFDPPAYPWLDALLTMGSVVAQYLLSRKIWDNWPLWVVVDGLSTVLYACMGMMFTSVLFGIFTIIAIRAQSEWKKTYESYE
ncbi:MAG: nicotinamide riboside transporter PnuC [Bacteroidales bacterium]|nr:nicotinamide riboside transporter PnuC [Bacteroidales bacterium]